MRGLILAICLCWCALPAWAEEIDPALEADPLDGLVISATMKQVIGRFNTHSFPEIGDTFEIDFRALPKDAFRLTPAKEGKVSHYLPFSAPLKMEHLRRGTSDKDKFTGIFLSSTDGQGDKFRMYIVMREREKGSKVSIQIFSDGGFRDIGSMAEAEGTLK